MSSVRLCQKYDLGTIPLANRVLQLHSLLLQAVHYEGELPAITPFKSAIIQQAIQHSHQIMPFSIKQSFCSSLGWQLMPVITALRVRQQDY